ncbi:MAG TPA: HlyD family efflux transporter periplasmic adaptor subunit [Polyangiales bacterium]|nr:HlyD family efflux transporter periplasmic adaptor subunit [Polyangiales bacterium]
MSTPFLAERPPWYARVTGLLLVAACAALVVFVVAVRLPDAVVAPFALRPPTSRAALTVPIEGVVTRVMVEEGEHITAKQVLVRISARGTADAVVARLRIEQRRRDLERLATRKERALGVFEARARALDPVTTQHHENIPLLRRSLQLASEQRERSEELHRQALSTLSELQDIKAKEVRARIDLQQEQSALAAAKAERVSIGAERDLEQAEYEKEERALEDELQTLTSGLSGHQGILELAEGGDLVVRAPCNGTVSERKVAGPGVSVEAGDVLLLVFCDEDVLRASVRLPQAKLPLVKLGQRVKLMYDALPYERWGVLYGTVSRVAPVPDDEGRFTADIQVDEQRLATSSGMIGLRPGMSGTARIVVGRRTLLDHALAPLRALRERWQPPHSAKPLAKQEKGAS